MLNVKSPNVKSCQEGLCLNIRETSPVLQKNPALRAWNGSHSLESLLLGLRVARG